MQAPSGKELLNQLIVREALDQAWHDSQPDDPTQRHEEGGWIYLDMTSGEIMVRRARSGGQALMDLAQPPIVPGALVVAKFHTHPNPTAEGWEPGPSDSDLRTDTIHGVPDLIRADDGVHFSGPDRRDGGLQGKPGYP